MSMNELWNEMISRAKSEERTFLMEHECKELLVREGITTTGTAVAQSAVEAVEISNKIGYPIVLKVLSPEVIHKSDLGGVKVNLQNAAEVKRAFAEIIKAFPNKKLAGVAVQKMAPPGLEAIIGVSRDSTFGPVLMFGLGGVFVEVLKDVSFRILPVIEADIEEMVKEIRGYNLLRGYRGTAVDLFALKELLFKVSALIMKYPEIMELDLNPVFLYPEGNITIDARIILEKPETEKPGGSLSKDKNSLQSLFYPGSIAVLGASDKPGKLGWNVFHNLLYHGFEGKLYPVNVKAKTIQGMPAFSKIDKIEDPIDTAIILVPAAQTLQAFEECCRKGIKMIIIESAGFAETGESGKNIEKELKRVAESYNCRFVGPNCSGIINTHHKMVQSIGVIGDLCKGNIGLIVQAGVYAAGIIWGMRHIMDLAIMATIGNKADINESDILEYLGEDDNVKVVCMYLEDVKNGRRFIDVARKVTANKPVIILKSGRTEAGKKAVSSHTASLAGNDLIYGAAFKQAGIIRARDNDHMFGLARAFSKQPLPLGDGTLVISYSGSLGVAAVDALSINNMRPAELDDETRQYLREILPPYVGCNNPVDYTFDMNAAQVMKTIEIGLSCEDISSFIIILQAEFLDTYFKEFKKLGIQKKPILISVPCREFAMNGVIALEQAGFPVYSTPEEAVEVLSVMYRYGSRAYLPTQ
ncbi:MAG: acetate--CoA ligase family protein [Actinobacteria bacterium]|nr:acetate--CoA ligase family protein [Actinomycetota bacterium]